MDEKRVVRVTIAGVVQGVGYRAWTLVEAERRGLAGFVRNRLNGSVEAVFAGPAAEVASMCEACRRGPRLAKVTSVEIEDVPASLLDGSRDGFHQRDTL
jgi:acylphosphatase